MSPPKITHFVTKFVIPFSPAGREFPDLVAARPAVPGLRDQFYAVEHWVLCACLQKTALVMIVLLFPPRAVQKKARLCQQHQPREEYDSPILE
jgi:hypothetical protein